MGGFWEAMGSGLSSGTIGTLGSLALGGASLYNSYQANQSASEFYDAAGATAQAQWDMKSPLIQAEIDRELGMADQITENSQAQLDLNSMLLEYQQGMLPDQMDFDKELFNVQQRMLPHEEALAFKQNHTQQRALEATVRDLDTYEQYRGIDDEYYKQSMEGIDPNSEADRAQADVAHAFKGTMDAANRALARRGVGPDAAGYQGQVTGNAIEQAKATGSARTTARRYAEDVNYSRLGSAMNARQRLAPATTGSVTTPSGSILPTTNFNPVGGNVSTANADPSSTYLALGNVAANGGSNSSNNGWDLIQRGLNG